MNIHANFQWSDDNVKRMKKLARDGHSGSFIARELGTSRSSVLGKLFRLNLKIGSAVQPKLAPEKKINQADPLFQASHPALNTKEYEADCLRLSILKCGARQCRYEVDSPIQRGEYRFCGRETDEGQSWCSHHRKLVFQPRAETLRAKAKAEHIARRAA